MGTMDIILKEDIRGLGRALAIVKVKNGYAQNYLFPRNMAILATGGNKKLLEADRARLAEQYLKEKSTAEKQAAKMEGVSVTLAARVTEGDKLYGSISTSEIAVKLKEKGWDLDRKKIKLEEPIKQLGMYTLKVELHREVEAKIKVWVISDESK